MILKTINMNNIRPSDPMTPQVHNPLGPDFILACTPIQYFLFSNPTLFEALLFVVKIG